MANKNIDQIQKWLFRLGSKESINLERLYDNELLLTRRLPNSIGYELFIWEDENAKIIVFQTLVFKVASGRSSINELNFNEILLAYNTHLNFAHFSIAEIEDSAEWAIILSSSRLSNEMRLETLLKIVQTFDYAFREMIPELLNIANKLELKFTGRIRRANEGSLRWISNRFYNDNLLE